MRRELPPSSRRPASRAFSVIELMVAVAIMSVIVIALYSVFDQTQRALRRTMTQKDILEGMRSATDLLVRDLEGAVPVKLFDTNLTSFAANVNPFSTTVDIAGLAPASDPVLRTSLQDVFFVNRQNDLWTAIGYWIGPVNTNQLGEEFSVGRLYRFSYSANSATFGFTNLYQRFNGPQRIADSSPVLDGVVHFRVVAYDTDWKPLVPTLVTNTPNYLRPWFPDPLRSTEAAYWFRRWNVPAFPAALEVEIGILEGPVVTRYAAIPVASEARKFLARHAGQIHLFRHRIPLRNAPPY